MENIKRKVIYHSILKSKKSLPDSIFEKSNNGYNWILNEEYKKTSFELENSIKNLNSRESRRLSEDLMSIVRAMPSNNNSIRNHPLVIEKIHEGYEPGLPAN